MKWFDIPFHPPSKTLRQFSALWLLFFLGLGGVQGLVREKPLTGAVLAILALGVGVAGLARPGAVRGIFVGWMVLVFPVGWLISQTMLALLYFGMFTPVALCFRLKGRDPLGLKPGTGQSSYWSPKPTPQDVRSYFRQY